VTTLLDALRAIERGDPFATRKAVDAIGIALDVLSESEAKVPATTPAVPQTRR
jgi:hypothetical protein